MDLSSGSGVANIGHCHPHIVKTMVNQASSLIHTGWNFASIPRILFLDKLKDKVPDELHHFMFAVTGSEGMETALNLACFYTKKTQFAAFHGSFQGKTTGSLGLTSRTSFKTDVSPAVSVSTYFHYPNCYHCPFRLSSDSCKMFCVQHMEETLNLPSGGLENLAGIVVEPVQDSEGIVVPPVGFYKRLREMADRLHVPLIFDELFTGMGRTGTFFAFEQEGIVPDILIFGKSIAGGLPLTIVAARKEITTSFPSIRYNSTFSGHPLTAALGIATLEIFEEEQLVERSAKMGDYLVKELMQLQSIFSLIGQVRGKGLMIGVELVRDEAKTPAEEEAKLFVRKALEYGLILLSGGNQGNVLKIMPPLTLSKEQADQIIQTFKRILIEIEEVQQIAEYSYSVALSSFCWL